MSPFRPQRPAQRDAPVQNSGAPVDPRKCYFCESPEHLSKFCTVFTSSQARIAYCDAKGFCHICLREHNQPCYRRWRKCLECGGPHHESLCEGVSNGSTAPVRPAPAAAPLKEKGNVKGLVITNLSKLSLRIWHKEGSEAQGTIQEAPGSSTKGFAPGIASSR